MEDKYCSSNYGLVPLFTDVAWDWDKICDAVERVYKAEHSKQDQTNYQKYIRIMEEIDWPAFINGDTIFHEMVIEQYAQGGSNAVITTIYDYYGALYLKGLEDQLATSKVIKPSRKPLFHEAFLLYQLGYYHGAVAILISQLVGIAADIEEYLKIIEAEYDPATKQAIHDRYGFKLKNDISRVVTAVLEGEGIDDEQGEYRCFVDYLRFRIFSNSISKESTYHHPNRNLICHGAQLNYGTKEHALKTILCIDALAWVAEVIADNFTQK